MRRMPYVDIKPQSNGQLSSSTTVDNMNTFQVTLIASCVLSAVWAGLPHAPVAQQPADFGFRYSVNDFNGNEHSHQQQRKGNAVTGQYKVLLPDGRLQTVTYVADVAGYRAKVDYTPAAPGEATTAGLNAKPIIPAASAINPSIAPFSVSGTIYPGSPGYPPYPLYSAVGSYGPGLIYGSPSSGRMLQSGPYGYRPQFYKRDLSGGDQQ